MRTLIAATMMALIASVTISEAASPKKAPASNQQQTNSTSSQPPAGQQGPVPKQSKQPHHRNKFTG